MTLGLCKNLLLFKVFYYITEIIKHDHVTIIYIQSLRSLYLFFNHKNDNVSLKAVLHALIV